MNKYYYVIFIFLFIEINTLDFDYQAIKINISNNSEFVPFSINIDFQLIDNQNIEINKTQIEIIKKNLNNAKIIFESLLSVNSSYHIIIDKNALDKIGNNNKLNNIKSLDCYGNLIIIPLFGNDSIFFDEFIDYKTFPENDTRPIIAIITLSKSIIFLNAEELFSEILHSFFHILGFRENARENSGIKRFCEGTTFENMQLRKVAKKYFGSYSPKVPLFNKNKKYMHWFKEFKYDIMSEKSFRITNINEFLLNYFQYLKWYRVNMNICGCSLKGECTFGILPYEIYINKDTLNLYCYRNEVFKEQCLVNNNIFFFKLKNYNDKNLNYKNNYFQNDKCINYDITYDYNINTLYKGLIKSGSNFKQSIILVSPIINNLCKCHLETIYLFNEMDKEYNKYVINNYKLKKIKIIDLNKAVYGSFSYYNFLHSQSFIKVLDYNNIFILNNEYSPNILIPISINDISLELMSHLGKYPLILGTKSHKKLGNKKTTYLLYSKFAIKFPNDFNYMPETYLISNQKNIIENKFKNYAQKENDLWICKPFNGSLGNGIYFLRNYEDFSKCDQLITKYIHNPHLLNNRKYHIRLYNFISSIDPLIIYIYKEGQVMRASHDYKYNLKDISDKQSFLTNGHVNFGKDGYLEDISLEELKKQIIKDGGDWNSIWNQFKDICIKLIITIYDEEYKKMKEYTKYEAKSFMFYGLDVLIDKNFKVWFLEANDSAHMEGYDKINKMNKIGFTTDILNILGIIPFDHSNNNPLENNDKCIFKDKIEEKINNAFCEFYRPKGNLERIFPIKENLAYYKKFFVKKYKENEELWKILL